MKQNPNIVRKCEYIPDNIAQVIVELAANSNGKPNVRHDNYLAIVSTIYFKCLNENDYAFIPYPIARNYWTKVLGGRYVEYLNDLLKVNVISREKKAGRWKYSIDFNFLLQLHKLVRVEYRTNKIKSIHLDSGFSVYNVDRIENRLGRRILRHLKKVTVDYKAFENSLHNGLLDINPAKFKIDLSEFPSDMDFDAEVHYHNGIKHHSHPVAYLLKVAKKLDHEIFYDKDKVKVINPDIFRMTKTTNFINHTKLNLLKTIDGNFELSRDESKTRRVFHTGVFLPSKALPFLRIDDQPIVGIDAKTSQFLLLANLFNAFSNDVDSIGSKFTGKRKAFIYDLYDVYKQQTVKTNDAFQFYNDVVNKDFYEVVRDILSLSHRSQAKIFCFSIIFSKPDSKNPFKQKIRERYPTVINTLDEYKYRQIARIKKEKGKKNINEGDGFQRLAINLQAMESEIFIEHIFQRLHKENIWCFTRHDSVIVGKHNQIKAFSIAESVYRDLGLKPKLKIEQYEIPEYKYINSLPNEWTFLYDIDEPNDITNLEIEHIFMLLEEYQQCSSTSEYNDLESRVIELDKNNLPLDHISINHLYHISTQLLSSFSTPI